MSHALEIIPARPAPAARAPAAADAPHHRRAPHRHHRPERARAIEVVARPRGDMRAAPNDDEPARPAREHQLYSSKERGLADWPQY